jgi:hypothetical protein
MDEAQISPNSPVGTASWSRSHGGSKGSRNPCSSDSLSVDEKDEVQLPLDNESIRDDYEYI